MLTYRNLGSLFGFQISQVKRRSKFLKAATVGGEKGEKIQLLFNENNFSCEMNLKRETYNVSGL